MDFFLKLGGIRFRFHSDCDIMIAESFAPFLCSELSVFDVRIDLSHDFSSAPLPCAPMAGEDVLMEYYWQDGGLLSMSKAGQGRWLSACLSSPDMSTHRLWLNFPGGHVADTLAHVLRMIPLRRILLSRGVLFLHASQVALGDTGILFTAPSQTGKTTQAKLWNRYRGAEILCNDRTLTDCRLTYGFPVDGSEPVMSGECRKLGAIVVLRQAPENTLRRLRPREALPLLMSQAVMDTWDDTARAATADRMLDLISKTPVYLLACTPDERAVQCLEQQLSMDGVISNANNSGSHS